jgi:hypothetical protein
MPTIERRSPKVSARSAAAVRVTLSRNLEKGTKRTLRIQFAPDALNSLEVLG